jgi:hypothetical protein
MATEHFIDPVSAGILEPGYIMEDMAEMCNDDKEEFIADKLTDYIRAKNLNLLRGDTVAVIIKKERDRNEGLFIWDGKKVMPLERDLDMYGHVPSCFKVTDTEFSPDYWFNTIQHNGIFHLPTRILKWFKFSIATGEDGDLLVTAQVSIGDKIWSVAIQEPEELDDPEDPTSGTPEFYKKLLLEGRFRTEYLGDPGCFDLTW